MFMVPAKRTLLDMARVILSIQGGLAITFGVAAMFWPGLTVLALTYLFSIFLIADGSILLLSGLAHWAGASRIIRVLWGVLQLGAGLFVLNNPVVSFAALIVFLGLSLVLRGAFGLTHAITRAADPPGERTMHSVLGGLGIIAGGVILVQPVAGGLAFVWVLGLYTLITGTVLISLACGLGDRPIARKHKT